MKGKRGGQQPGKRQNLKRKKRPEQVTTTSTTDAMGLAGMSGISSKFSPPESFNAFNQLLEESMTWSKLLLFNQAEVQCESVDMIDLCAEQKNNSHTAPFLFPERFTGLISWQRLKVELKVAAMQSGFLLETRSSKSKKNLNGSLFDQYITLSCQQGRKYIPSKASDKLYDTTTKQCLSTNGKCCFSLKIALITELPLSDENKYNFERSTSLGKQFYRSSIGRWILVPERKFSIKEGQHENHLCLRTEHLHAEIQLMSMGKKQLVKDYSQICFSAASTSALINVRHELGMPPLAFKDSQINALCQKAQAEMSDLTPEASSADKLIESFQNREGVNF